MPDSLIRQGRPPSRYLPGADATLEFELSNGLIESTNTKIQLLTRMVFGFKNPDALIGLAMLSLGGLKPPLPGRVQVGMTH